MSIAGILSGLHLVGLSANKRGAGSLHDICLALLSLPVDFQGLAGGGIDPEIGGAVAGCALDLQAGGGALGKDGVIKSAPSDQYD
jgi:hypothetical protein